MAIPDELYNIKFAGYFESIKKMYDADKKFKTICDEYCISVAEAEKYDIAVKGSPVRREASKRLCRELEEEILFYILRNR